MSIDRCQLLLGVSMIQLGRVKFLPQGSCLSLSVGDLLRSLLSVCLELAIVGIDLLLAL